MAIYDTGTASLAANGQVTGVGTQWTMPLTLIRVGATLVFKTEPVQIYTISEITSDTSMAVYNPNGETVPAGTGYAILAHDGISVQGLAQNVAETLRYYQSRETSIQSLIDFIGQDSFDWPRFEQLASQSVQGAADALASQIAAAESAATAVSARDTTTSARDATIEAINSAGDAGTLVTLSGWGIGNGSNILSELDFQTFNFVVGGHYRVAFSACTNAPEALKVPSNATLVISVEGGATGTGSRNIQVSTYTGIDGNFRRYHISYNTSGGVRNYYVRESIYLPGGNEAGGANAQRVRGLLDVYSKNETFQKSLNFSDVADKSLARSNLGLSSVDSIYELIKQTNENKNLANVRSYISGSNSGGGLFYWSPLVSKSEHNGITVFSPTVPFDGTYSTLSDFLSGAGETSPGENGCWVRFTGGVDDIHTEWAGHDVSGVNESNASVMACINLGHNTNRKVRISAGRLKVSFSTDIQYNDKYNVLRKTAFFINGLNVDIFANNDVEIDISGSSSPERVVFGAKNCTLKASGLNWNSDFSDYSIQPLDTTHKPREDWFGFMVEGCASVLIERMEVNASRAFVNADALNGLSNAFVSLRDSNFRYNANYCLLTRNCDYSEFIGNTTKQSGRAWHTFAEDYAISEKSKRSYAHANKFYYPISIQSRITPAGNNITVTDNYYEGSGIFVEVFAANNVICKGNTSIITTDATGRASSHYLLITNDSESDWGVNEGLSNILIADNIMIGGGVAIQGYQEGVQAKNGLIITGNTMTDTKAPYITNQGWVGTIFSNNSCKFTPGFGALSIGGQYPTIKDNILDGGFVQLRVGYEVVAPTYEGNKFMNTVASSLTTMFDMDNFTGGIFRNNDFRASSFLRIFPLNKNVTKVGFRYVDYGFSARPTDKYGEKCVIRAGDFILNDNPTTYGSAYAWFGATNGAYLQVNTAS
ncbi:tail fiber protein [Escherichia phage vB_EcoS_CEB_EC3a]|uniref:Tail fiber protein n=1 Tax=Escherichia phage vB_EcoS_CEB_EC3a TaxID=1933774 RepID=A0A1Q1PW79_9CAUD|nr:tail fiber protein [Escherichia phage vB_EcoS_CEB_EC3a]AQN32354.1 tail fiber protein [Escherichia phage vB_EcoS_CEB_EC3a]